MQPPTLSKDKDSISADTQNKLNENTCSAKSNQIAPQDIPPFQDHRLLEKHKEFVQKTKDLLKDFTKRFNKLGSRSTHFATYFKTNLLPLILNLKDKDSLTRKNLDKTLSLNLNFLLCYS